MAEEESSLGKSLHKAIVAIIGAGTMGSGIAQVAAMSGHDVILCDVMPEAVDRARDILQRSLSKLVDKSKLSPSEAAAITERIHFTREFNDIQGAGILIEAIVEDEDVKRKLFTRIESIVDREAIIATNTSSLSVTGLAAGLGNPGRFIGIHFFNPPQLMKLVEVIPALQSAPGISNDIIRLMESWGKTCVTVQDTPGFIVNRIARPFYSEALRMAEEQLASPQMIDEAMKEMGGFRMGPFELMDFIGNDINYAVTNSVWTSMFFESRYKPSLLQGNMVRAGWLGKKSGKGFYDYSSPGGAMPSVRPSVTIPVLTKKEICDRIVTMLINEAADAVYRGIASRDDIDLAMTTGVNYPKGLLRWADEIGIRVCVDRMDTLYDHYREERYRCSPVMRSMAKTNSTFYES